MRDAVHEEDAAVKQKPSRDRVNKGGRWLSFLSIAVVLVAWFLATEDGFAVIQPIKFPSPRAVAGAVWFNRSLLFGDIVATLRRVLIGFLIGTALGIGAGLWMAYSRRIFYLLNPLIEGARPVPAIAMVPFFLLWFGLAEAGKLLLTSFGVFTIIVVSTIEAARNVPQIYVNAALTLGATRRQIFRKIVLPKIVPELIGPLRVALALSFTLVVAAEFMGARSGLGYRLALARTLFRTDLLFLGVVLFGVIAGLTDTVLRRVLAFLTRWSGRSSV